MNSIAKDPVRISLIAAYYKDIEALKLIIDAVKIQNYDNFELIIAEDNDDPKLKEYLETTTEINIIHTSQKDDGIRKARSVNNAIIKSTGDYLIFIDADCIPYSTFVSSHAKLAEKGHVLSGRRINLGPRVSSLLRKRTLLSTTLERFFYIAIPALLIDGVTHLGQGVHFDPDGYIYKNHISRRKRSSTSLLGCNFSCFKSDIVAINGFDESYGELALPDDTDIQWRFEAYGLILKTCKMSANIFHLHHKKKKVFTSKEKARLLNNRMAEKKSKGSYEATIGISTHNT